MFIDTIIIKIRYKPFLTIKMAHCFSAQGSDGYFFRLSKDKPALHSNFPPSSAPKVSRCHSVPIMTQGHKIYIMLMERDASMKNYSTIN